jgi:hypothetical protein
MKWAGMPVLRSAAVAAGNRRSTKARCAAVATRPAQESALERDGARRRGRRISQRHETRRHIAPQGQHLVQRQAIGGRGGAQRQRPVEGLRLLVLARELRLDHGRQTGTAPTAAERLAELLVEQRFVHPGLVAVEHSLTRRRIAHGFEHHLQEQGLELPGHHLVRRRIARPGLAFERSQTVDIENVGGDGGTDRVVGLGHGDGQNRMEAAFAVGEGTQLNLP